MPSRGHVDDEERTEAYPLCWPAGWPRRPAQGRRGGKFARGGSRSDSGYTPSRGVTIAEAMRRAHLELSRLGADRIVISTNLRVRSSDGEPVSKQAQPIDPGAAAYWTTKRGDRRCIAVDMYDRVEQNVAAIAATLEAFRAVERHGGAQVIDRAFTGFRAIPNLDAPRPWRVVMGIDKLEKELGEPIDLFWLEKHYKNLAHTRHPDKGGTDKDMAELNRAYEEGRREVSA